MFHFKKQKQKWKGDQIYSPVCSALKLYQHYTTSTTNLLFWQPAEDVSLSVCASKQGARVPSLVKRHASSPSPLNEKQTVVTSERNSGSHIYKTLTNHYKCEVLSHSGPILRPRSHHVKQRTKTKPVYAEMDGGQHLHLTSIVIIAFARHVIVNPDNLLCSSSKNKTLITLVLSW